MIDGSRSCPTPRGSLLDVILKTYEVRTQMWEGLLERLRHLDVVGETPRRFSIRDQVRSTHWSWQCLASSRNAVTVA
jgi:hypothetical protein